MRPHLPCPEDQRGPSFGDPFTATPIDGVGTSDGLLQAVTYDTGSGSDPDCTDGNHLVNKGNEYGWVHDFTTDDPGPRRNAAATGLSGHTTAANHHRVTR